MVLDLNNYMQASEIKRMKINIKFLQKTFITLNNGIENDEKLGRDRTFR